jgi:fatty acid synthase subunit beta
MTYHVLDNIKMLPMFSGIDVRKHNYAFSHLAGLFVAQFAQIALIVTEKAAFEYRRQKTGQIMPRQSSHRHHREGEANDC